MSYRLYHPFALMFEKGIPQSLKYEIIPHSIPAYSKLHWVQVMQSHFNLARSAFLWHYSLFMWGSINLQIHSIYYCPLMNFLPAVPSLIWKQNRKCKDFKASSVSWLHISVSIHSILQNPYSLREHLHLEVYKRRVNIIWRKYQKLNIIPVCQLFPIYTRQRKAYRLANIPGCICYMQHSIW